MKRWWKQHVPPGERRPPPLYAVFIMILDGHVVRALIHSHLGGGTPLWSPWGRDGEEMRDAAARCLKVQWCAGLPSLQGCLGGGPCHCGLCVAGGGAAGASEMQRHRPASNCVQTRQHGGAPGQVPCG
jgi:hypothetical protein